MQVCTGKRANWVHGQIKRLTRLWRRHRGPASKPLEYQYESEITGRFPSAGTPCKSLDFCVKAMTL